jgi:hypothetical protein
MNLEMAVAKLRNNPNIRTSYEPAEARNARRQIQTQTVTTKAFRRNALPCHSSPNLTRDVSCLLFRNHVTSRTLPLGNTCLLFSASSAGKVAEAEVNLALR